MRARALMAVGLLVLTGCATMNEDECRTADWKLVGFEDGTAGKPQSTIGVYRKDCAKAGVAPNLDRYQQGYAQGVSQYCVKGNGYRVGVRGGAYYNVCPKELEPAFLTAYRHGQDLYAVRRDIRNMQKTIQQDQSNLEACQQDLTNLKNVIISSQSTADERLKALTDMKGLQQQRDDYVAQVEHDQRQLDLMRRDADSLQLQHQRMGY